MATLVYDFDYDFIKKQFERTYEERIGLTEAILYSGAQIAIEEWVKAISDADLIEYGDLIDSIGVDKKGVVYRGGLPQVKVGAQGKDRKGVRNGLKLGVLNYGSSSIKGHFIQPKVQNSTDASFRLIAQYILDTFVETGKFPKITKQDLQPKKRAAKLIKQRTASKKKKGR